MFFFGGAFWWGFLVVFFLVGLFGGLFGGAFWWGFFVGLFGGAFWWDSTFDEDEIQTWLDNNEFENREYNFYQL